MFQATLVIGAAAVGTWIAIWFLFPLLERYALARPNARSSHKVPTAQGGGAAVILVTLVVGWAAVVLGRSPLDVAVAQISAGMLAVVSVAVLTLAGLGAYDDIRPLSVRPRLGIQFAAAATIVWTVPEGWRSLAELPAGVEILILVVGLVWFINLTNFMDGIDWMTVVQMVPVSVGLAILGTQGALPEPIAFFALALAGSLIGFAPYNRHVARLFLGDVGSISIGALVGWMLILVAAGGNFFSALLLPLYYVMDATSTLFRRWRRGERLSEAHRSHFYQIATSRGFRVPEVTTRVFIVNVILVLLSFLAVGKDDSLEGWMLLCAGVLLVAALLLHFDTGPAPRNPAPR